MDQLFEIAARGFRHQAVTADLVGGFAEKSRIALRLRAEIGKPIDELRELIDRKPDAECLGQVPRRLADAVDRRLYARDAVDQILDIGAESNLDSGHRGLPDLTAREHREQLVEVFGWARFRLYAVSSCQQDAYRRCVSPCAAKVFEERRVDLVEDLVAGPAEIDD